MQSYCTQIDSCIHFFPGMGFRPAVHVMQRDQYGDHPVLIVGDDSPLQGKVPPGYFMADLAVDPYAPLGGAPASSWATPTVLASSGGFTPGGIPFWPGGGSSQPPTIGGGSSEPPTIGGGSSEPPDSGDTSTQPPDGPDLPPLQPVPGPETGVLLLSAILILSLVQAARRRFCA